LEVLATPRKEGLPRVGECIALDGPGRHLMGPSADGQIVIEVDVPKRPATPLRSCRMSQSALMSLASSNDTLLNGALLSQPRTLQHGDVVEIIPGLVLRYFTHEAPKARSVQLEAAIGDEPDDDGRWQVYADWLLQRAEPLGRRIVEGPDGDDDDARWLEAMARPWRRGNLELSWRHGFVHTAKVRALEWEIAPDTYWCLERLFELEICRFVEAVHVDLFTTELDHVRPPFEARARRILESMRHAPRTLKRISLGPVVEMSFPPDLKRELSCLREERPRLVTDESTLVQRFSRMVLKDVHGLEIELTDEETVHRFGIESLRVTKGKYGVAWAERIEPRLSPAFLANGHRVWQARLMPGDVIEPAPGTKLTVEAT
jgi:uncharacterized protein (TIGR02996 family)